ncbi:MAG TPA: aminodeoxychorismate lyase [Gammaproteobacteria bacterium]|nr:aminodeoxychorismate lyase [Gammaproteobacteria bacterium]
MDCYIDGRRAQAVPLDDRGLAYGDGLFETLRVERGRVRHLSRHLARLRAGCERLGLGDVDFGAIANELERRARAGDGVLKLMLTRVQQARGYRVAADARVRRILCRAPLPQWGGQPAREGVRLHLCTFRLATQPRLAGIKHLNRLEQVLARAEWRDPAIAEGILCDARGRLVDGTMSNLFLLRADNVLVTPALDECGVAGVMRSVLIDLAREQGMPLEITRVSRQDAARARELFICNSLIGLWPVRCLEGVGEYPPGPVAAALGAALETCEEGSDNWYPR